MTGVPTVNLYITASGVENHIDRLFTGIPTVLNRGEKIADITAEPNGFWQERGLSNVIVEFLQESDSDKDAGLFLDDIAIVQGNILFVY